MKRALLFYIQGALAATWYPPTIKECYTGSYTYRWDNKYDHWHVGAMETPGMQPYAVQVIKFRQFVCPMSIGFCVSVYWWNDDVTQWRGYRKECDSGPVVGPPYGYCNNPAEQSEHAAI